MLNIASFWRWSGWLLFLPMLACTILRQTPQPAATIEQLTFEIQTATPTFTPILVLVDIPTYTPDPNATPTPTITPTSEVTSTTTIEPEATPIPTNPPVPATKAPLPTPTVPLAEPLQGGVWDFEDGFEPWAYSCLYGDLTVEVVQELVDALVPEPPIEGGSCLHLVVPTPGEYPDYYAVLQQPVHFFETGKKYTLSAFLKCHQGTLDIRFKPELGQDPWTGYGDQVFTMTEEWAEYSVTTPVFTEDVSPATITFHISFTEGDFWIDGVRFYEGEYVPPDLEK